MKRRLLAMFAWMGVACADPQPEPSWRDLVGSWTWPEPIPDISLTDEQGRAFSLGRYRDDWLVMGWVFTRCADARACPMTMTKMVAVQERWRDLEGGAGDRKVSLLALTLDPDWDTPERLADYGRSHGADPARFTLATGPRDLMTEGIPAMFSILALPDADVRLVHTVKIVLLRPGLVFEAEWKDDAADPDDILRRVLSETPPR